MEVASVDAKDGRLAWLVSFPGKLRLADVEYDAQGRTSVLLVLMDAASGQVQGVHLVRGAEGTQVTARDVALGAGGRVHVGVQTMKGTVHVGGAAVAVPVATHLLVTLDTDFALRWHKQLGETANDLGPSREVRFEADAAGELYLLGYANGTLRFGGRDYLDAPWPNYRGYVARIGPDGEERWLRTRDSEAPLNMLGIGGVDLELWRDNELALVFAHSDTLQVCGVTSREEQGTDWYNGMLVVLDREGQCRWARSLASAPYLDVRSMRVAQGAGGAVYMGGIVGPGYWPFPSTETVRGRQCPEPGYGCSTREDGFLMRIGR
jgi:hypothetical protein